MRKPTAVGAGCSLAVALAGAAWVLVAKPFGPVALIAWFAVLGLAGIWLPGLANQVTLARAQLAAPGFVYAVSPQGLVPLAAVVALAGLSDMVDGRLARRAGGPTGLGGGLDPVVDGLFFGAVAVGLAAGGAFPVWLAVAVVLRYAVPAGAGGLLLLGRRRPRLRHTPLGQASTALVAVLLGGLALLRGLGRDSGLLLAASEILIPLAMLATFANLAWTNRTALAAPDQAGLEPPVSG